MHIIAVRDGGADCSDVYTRTANDLSLCTIIEKAPSRARAFF